MAECVLCEIIARERPGFIIKETEQIAVLLSLEGHPLVVPKKHIEDVFEIDDQCAAAVMREAVSVSIALLKRIMDNCSLPWLIARTASRAVSQSGKNTT